MSSRAIARSTLWQMASQITMAALSIVTVKLVATALSKELAGEYNSAYGYLQIFGILADFGLYAVAVREVSRATDRVAVLGSLIVLRAAVLAVSLGAALLFVWILPAWRGTPLPPSVSIAALVPFFTLLAGILRTVFQVHYALHYVFIAEVAQRVLTVGAAVAVVASGARGSDDPAVLFLLLLSGGAGAALLFGLSVLFASRLMRVRPHWHGPTIRRLLRMAAPYGLAFLCTALYRQFDVTMIALLRPADYDIQNAYYGFVQRMMDMAYLLPTFLLNSALPILSERHAKGEDVRGLLGKTLLTTLLIGSTALLFAALWSRPLMELLTHETYLSTAERPGSDTALRLLSVSMFCNALITYAFYVLLTRHAWKALVACLAGAAVLSICLNALLIPEAGFVGAARTSVVTHALLAACLLPLSLRALPARMTGRQFGQWAAYTVLLGAGLLLAAPALTSSPATAAGLALAGAFIGLLAVGLGLHRTLAGRD